MDEVSDYGRISIEAATAFASGKLSIAVSASKPSCRYYGVDPDHYRVGLELEYAQQPGLLGLDEVSFVVDHLLAGPIWWSNRLVLPKAVHLGTVFALDTVAPTQVRPQLDTYGWLEHDTHVFGAYALEVYWRFFANPCRDGCVRDNKHHRFQWLGWA